MASGKNVAAFAVPALRPLVMHLFMRSVGKPSEELSAQREVRNWFYHNYTRGLSLLCFFFPIKLGHIEYVAPSCQLS